MDASALDAGLYTALSGSTALTSLLSGGTASPSVYSWVAPQNADPPYVVFQTQSPARPFYTFGTIAYEDMLITIRGVTSGPGAAAAGTIAKRIDDAIDGQTLTITGYTQMYLWREQDVDYPEFVEGLRHQHRGAIYRLAVRD